MLYLIITPSVEKLFRDEGTFPLKYQSAAAPDKRFCQESWFKTFIWLTFCKVRLCSCDDNVCLFTFFRKYRQQKKVYCFYCRAAADQNLHRKTDLSSHLSFSTAGFCNWKMLYMDFVCMKAADFISNVSMQFNNNR